MEGLAYTREWLCEAVRDARERTFDLVADLSDDEIMGPRLAIVNPLRWEIAHVAWFQEFWALRRAGAIPSLREDADALYDSMKVPQDTRWDLPLLSRGETLAYMSEVRDGLLDRLASGPLPDDLVYFTLLSIFHEDMHDEAFTYTRQTLGYPPPHFSGQARKAGTTFRRAGRRPAPAGPRPDSESLAEHGRADGGPLAGDAAVPGGEFLLGASPDEPFVFDNEKWAHRVEIGPFRIARAPVTQSEFEAFVEDGGYRKREAWSEAGWKWCESEAAERPVYWRKSPEGVWTRRDFDRWAPIEPHRPVIHVNWYEADAFCRWSGRRLPTEAEWEMAASWDAAAARKRRFPWGDEPPTPERANLDGGALGCLDVAALAAGDSAFGCRQMIGNVWEWTSTDFAPYPGFVPDPYKEYSQPWFQTHKVLRGGCWATRSRLLRDTWRNFYEPWRRDVWAGFRTCALLAG